MKTWKRTLHTRTRPNLSLQFCGRFEVLHRVGPIAYQLAFPSHNKVHNVFQLSLLNKYVHDITYIIDWKMLQMELKGNFLLEPLYILDKREKWL